jgi:hypothetical protein
MLTMFFMFFWAICDVYMLTICIIFNRACLFTLSVGAPPVPLTPDYGAPNVSYADGVFDPHFSRYVTVVEGT